MDFILTFLKEQKIKGISDILKIKRVIETKQIAGRASRKLFKKIVRSDVVMNAFWEITCL